MVCLESAILIWSSTRERVMEATVSTVKVTRLVYIARNARKAFIDEKMRIDALIVIATIWDPKVLNVIPLESVAVVQALLVTSVTDALQTTTI